MIWQVLVGPFVILRRQLEDLLGEVDRVLESKVVHAETVTEKPNHSVQAHTALKSHVVAQSPNMHIKAHQVIKSKTGSYPSQVKRLFQLKPTFKWVRKIWTKETSPSGTGSGLGVGQAAGCSAWLSASSMVSSAIRAVLLLM